MKALILCAGQGTRLLPHTEMVPKCMVSVAGAPIIDYQLRALAGRVDEVVLVTGYLHEVLDDYARGRATVVHNDEYATTNSIYSLFLARERVAGHSLLLLNGDVLFDAHVLDQLLDHPAPTALLVDDKVALIAGEMNVVVRDGLVVQIGKELSLEQANAQSLQMVKFSPADSDILFARVAEHVARGEVNRFPTYAYEAIFRASAMAAVPRDGGTWYEIDTVDDLARCEELLASQAASVAEGSEG